MNSRSQFVRGISKKTYKLSHKNLTSSKNEFKLKKDSPHLILFL